MLHTGLLRNLSIGKRTRSVSMHNTVYHCYMHHMRLLFICVLLVGSPSLIVAQNLSTRSSEVTLDTGTGTLAGSLIEPLEQESRPSIALIVAGSGPTDRNGNSALIQGDNNSLLYLAEALAGHGIATLRYDKRGVGMSALALTGEEDLTFDVYVDDVRQWVEYLVSTKKYSSVNVIGHSEGSLLALVAALDASIDKVVSISGAGFPADEILRKQLSQNLSPGSYQTADSALAEIKSSGRTDLRPAQGAALFRASIQPYLHSWFKYDPATVGSRLQQPVLVVQGTTDIQVGVDDAERLATKTKNSTLVVIEGMNHVLKMVGDNPEEQTRSYSDPDLEISDELITSIVGFLKN